MAGAARRWELLKLEKIPCEVVPGVTSAIAVPAYNGIPVTHRDFCSSAHIITGHKKKDEKYDIDFEALVRTKGTLVFLMGVKALPDITEGASGKWLRSFYAGSCSSEGNPGRPETDRRYGFYSGRGGGTSGRRDSGHHCGRESLLPAARNSPWYDWTFRWPEPRFSSPGRGSSSQP